jgi:ABC-type branched-subunit amino acid transport system substrate-binding protein
VYDTYRSVDVVTNILKKPELLSADMIIGPFYSHEEGPVIEFSKTNGIIHISPFSNINGKVNDNPNCIRLQPSFRNQLQGLIDFAADSLVNPNIIVVHNKAEEEQETLAGVQQNIADVLKSKGIGRSSYKEINYKEGGYSALVSAFSATQPNVIITLMRGEAFVASYLTSLNKIRDKYDLYVVVNPQWMAYNNVDLNHLVNLKGIGYSAHFIDYGDEATKDFIRSFRERYKTEPDPYAFQGYDIAWFFLSGLSEYGKGFIHCLNTLDYSTMHTHYSFEQSTTGGGFENSTVNVFLYQDYKLVLKYRR